MTIRDLMTANPLTVGPHDSLAVAAERMWAGDCGCLPVVNDQGVVIAMITDRDICMAAWSRHEAPHDVQVQDAMSKSVATCRSDDTLESVEGAMRLARVRRVPVVDGEGKLEGIVSLADIVVKNVRRTHPQGPLHENNGLSTTLAVICERQALQASSPDDAVPGEPEREHEREAPDDASLHSHVTAPEGFGPAPGGYGPASAPAGAHGGDGIFGAEGAGGGPGNDPSPPRKEEDAAE